MSNQIIETKTLIKRILQNKPVDILYENNSKLIEKYSFEGIQYVRKSVRSIIPAFTRVLCKNEVNALNKLIGVVGTQQLIGQDSENSFISLLVEGTRIDFANNLNSIYFDNLKKILDEIHKKGIADLDFGHETDLLVQKDGTPCIIDFASSIIYDENSRFAFTKKPFFDYVCRLNNKYLLKRKAKYFPNEVNREEYEYANSKGFVLRIFANYQFARRYLKYKVLKIPSQTNYFSS